MKKIRLVIFASMLHDSESVLGSRAPLFEALRSFSTLEISYPSLPLPEDDSRTICFIATGGTEELFKQYLKSNREKMKEPVILLSDGFHNSLAAAFEISTFLMQSGVECCLLNAPLDYNPRYFQTFSQKIFGELPPIVAEDLSSKNTSPYITKNELHLLSKQRIGLIGGQSSWLISSDIDRTAVENTYGVSFVDIPLSEVEAGFAETDPGDRQVKKVCLTMERFLSGDRTPEDLKEAAKLYVALKGVCSKYQLNALTIKCFDLLEPLRTTACLALALLNDEGIVAGCEGDIPALWTMLYAKLALKKPAFMANPSSSNRAEYTIDFAHCTVPMSMLHGFRLPSHFESSIGIGVAGSVPSGRYRILKFSGAQLDRFYSAAGSILMNTNVPQRCRTQIRFKFDSEADYNGFFTTAKGNHVILVAE